MIAAMLVGAWFLIHQHCCFADAVSPRSIMVDPLMRRSPLEKNFIRFGRSWPHAPSFEPHLHDSEDRPVDSNNWNIGQRDVRGKENFIRFGRTLTRIKPKDAGSKWDFTEPHTNHDGLKFTANDLELLSSKFHSKLQTDDSMFPRKSRTKQNFIRFGRSNAMLNKNKKYSGHNKDNFIRFGRKDSDDDADDSLQSDTDDEYVGARESRGKDKGGKTAGYIRFGKSSDLGHFPDYGRNKRSLAPASQCNNTVESCKPCLLERALDPTALVAPEFSLLPKLPFQHTPIKKNFIRLG